MLCALNLHLQCRYNAVHWCWCALSVREYLCVAWQVKPQSGAHKYHSHMYVYFYLLPHKYGKQQFWKLLTHPNELKLNEIIIFISFQLCCLEAKWNCQKIANNLKPDPNTSERITIVLKFKGQKQAKIKVKKYSKYNTSIATDYMGRISLIIYFKI